MENPVGERPSLTNEGGNVVLQYKRQNLCLSLRFFRLFSALFSLRHENIIIMHVTII